MITFRMFRECFCAAMAFAALVVSTPSHAAWKRAESPLFVVYSDGSQKELVDFTQKLERFDALLRAFTGSTAMQPSPIKLQVYLVSNLREVRDLVPQLDLTDFLYQS